jgi:glycosyltransferase involved in cell wall biosynthesis
VIPTLNPADGGPPRIALRLAASTAALGHEVTILYHDTPAARPAIDQQLAEVPGSDRVHYQILPPRYRLENLFPGQACKEIDRVIGKFNIVHIHSIWDGLSRAGMMSAYRHSVPFVVLANGMLDPWSLAQKRLKKRLFLTMGLRKLMNRAAFFQAGNIDEKAGFVRAGIKTRIEIIPNGIDPLQFEHLPPAGQFYAAHPELKNRPYIVFMGRLHHKKGLDFLAAAFTELAPKHPDLQLVVAGPDEGARADFEADIRQANLSDRTHILGPLFGPERFTLLRDAACFCLPSRQEGFSVAVLETMACAVPVVISEPCHFPQVAERGAGIVVPLDVPAITAALDRIVSDAAVQKNMSQAARQLVFEKFTWPQIADQLVAAYKSVT